MHNDYIIFFKQFTRLFHSQSCIKTENRLSIKKPGHSYWTSLDRNRAKRAQHKTRRRRTQWYTHTSVFTFEKGRPFLWNSRVSFGPFGIFATVLNGKVSQVFVHLSKLCAIGAQRRSLHQLSRTSSKVGPCRKSRGRVRNQTTEDWKRSVKIKRKTGCHETFNWNPTLRVYVHDDLRLVSDVTFVLFFYVWRKQKHFRFQRLQFFDCVYDKRKRITIFVQNVLRNSAYEIIAFE